MPSGLWEAHEYAKLIQYEGETFEQPAALFACHATPEAICCGWAVVSGDQSLALRLSGLVNDIPVPSTPLFNSHLSAALHGLEEIETPSRAARVMVDRLLRRYSRLRDDPPDTP